MTRLAILASHPVQYYAPLFRTLATKLDLTVFYAHDATTQDQARAGFGVGFAWDVDLLSGYRHVFLANVARDPGLGRFSGVDTPEIGRHLREGRFDVLLLMGWYLKSFIQGLVAAKWLGLPIIVRGDSHLDTPRSALKVAVKHVVYPYFLRQFNAAVVVGKRNRAYWEYYGYPTSKMFYSPHCVDNSFFAERASSAAGIAIRDQLAIPRAAKVVLFVGKLVSFKRPLDVIKAVAQINTGIEVVIAGDGPLAGELTAQAECLKVRIHMLGFRNQSEMPGVYAASDVLVLPSDGRETWGLVVNEALASGRPTLVSDQVGCAPDIEEQLGGFVIYPMGDTERLAAAIELLLESPISPSKLAYAASQFTLQKAADGILNAAMMLSNRRHQR